MNRSLDIVYNCCKVPSNRIYYEESKAVDALLKIREVGREYPSEADITALLALGYLLDESNNDKIISGQGRPYCSMSCATQEIQTFADIYLSCINCVVQ